MTMTMHRRRFLTGFGAAIVSAPAIVRVASLMPVRGIVMPVSTALESVANGIYVFTAVTFNGINFHLSNADMSGLSTIDGVDLMLGDRVLFAPGDVAPAV